MRTYSLAFLAITALSSAALAQSAENTDATCKAPVALDDKACADVHSAGVPGGVTGSLEQRDDGYYVFVPRQGE